MVQKPVRPGKKCACDDNECSRATLLPRDAAAEVSTEGGRNQRQILRETCCLKLKDDFVHHSMRLTTSRRCLQHLQIGGGHTQCKAKLISSGLTGTELVPELLE